MRRRRRRDRSAKFDMLVQPAQAPIKREAAALAAEPNGAC
jgi:hypothetical protein